MMIKQSSSNNNRNTFTQNKKKHTARPIYYTNILIMKSFYVPPLLHLVSLLSWKQFFTNIPFPKELMAGICMSICVTISQKISVHSLSFSLIRYTLVIAMDWFGLLLEEEETVCLKTWRHNCKATKSYKATTTRTTTKQPSTTVTGKAIRKMYLLERERKRDALICCFLFSWMVFLCLCIPTSINLSVRPPE